MMEQPVRSSSMRRFGGSCVWVLGWVTIWAPTPAHGLMGFRAGLFVNEEAFAALMQDGSIVAWGHDDWGGGTDAPSSTDTGYVDIYSNKFAFVARKADGSLTAWEREVVEGQHVC